MFIFCVEVLTTAIRKSKIIGIYVYCNEVKIRQHRDDTTLITDVLKESFLPAFAILDNFRELSGLNLNNKKTEASWTNPLHVCKKEDFMS